MDIPYEEPLAEVPNEDIPELLKELRSDLPLSIQAFQFIQILTKWKKCDPQIEGKILALNGDYTKKIIAVYTFSPSGSHTAAIFHKWSHTNEDDHILADVVRKTKLVPYWKPHFLLTALTKETADVVIPLMKELFPTDHHLINPTNKIQWMPREEAERLEVEAPSGTHIEILAAAHAKEVNEQWKYKFDGSEEYLSRCLQLNFGLGLFDSATGELMSWALQGHHGPISVLQTKESHKNKGYGKLITKAMARELARRDSEVFASVVEANHISLKLFNSINFKLAFTSCFYHKTQVLNSN